MFGIIMSIFCFAFAFVNFNKRVHVCLKNEDLKRKTRGTSSDNE